MSTLFVDTINEKTSGNGVQIPGHVLQVVQARTTSLFTHTAGAGTYSSNITNLEAIITPKSASSKILIICDVFGSTANNNYTALWDARLMRGTTVIEDKFLRHHESASADNASGGGSVSSTFLDSPSTTSATTYGVQITQRITSGSLVTYVNGTQSGGLVAGSSIIAMEIAQ